MVTKGWQGHDLAGMPLEIAIAQLCSTALDTGKQPRGVHYPAPQDDPARLDHGLKGYHQLGEIISDDQVGWMVGGELAQLGPPARPDSRTAGQSLQTGAVKGTDPGKGRIGGMKARPEMAHLRVAQAPMHLTIDDKPTTDPGTYGHIDTGPVAAARPPTRLGETCGIDVGLQGHRNPQGAVEVSGEVGILPARLGGSGDMAPSGGSRVQVEGTETGHSDRPERPLPRQPVHHRPQGCLRISGLDPGLRAQILGASSHSHAELGAPGLDTAIERPVQARIFRA